MRNLKRALSLGLTAAMISGLMVMGSSAASYADVTSENNVEAIEVLESVGIMIGDESGNFNPDQNVTRNEMAVVMANLMEYNVASYKDTSPFTDVPSWAEPYVAACWTNGITAGYSDTIYGGSDTVTTAQAALMLMKALGYFQYASDFGGDWQLATTRQGNAIDLFTGVDSGVTQAMTRNDVAQLVLNTLRSGTVEASTDGSWTIGDVTINNNVRYSYITSNQDYADAIDDVKSTSNTTDANRYVVELGEQLYQGDLELNDNATDVFGRPARTWSYDSKEIGTYAKTELLKQSYTTKVTGRELYDLLGSNVVDTYDVKVTIDGVTDHSINGAIFNETAINRNNKAGVGATGNGVLTEVYVDQENKNVDIAIINTYLAIADDDYNEKQEDVSVTIYGITEKVKDEYVKATEDGHYSATMDISNDDLDVTDVLKDDVMLVTVANGEVQSIGTPETLSAVKISSFKVGDSLTSNGTTYDYADSLEYDWDTLEKWTDGEKTINLKDLTYNVYLDQYGYAIGVVEVEKPNNYLFLTGIDGNYNNLANSTYKANAIFLDGTMATITIDGRKSDFIDDMNTDTTADDKSVLTGEEDDATLNRWFTYTVNNSDVYTVKLVDIDAGVSELGQSTEDRGAKGLDEDFDNGVIDYKHNSTTDGVKDRVYGNDETVYLTVSIDDIETKKDRFDVVIDDVDSVAVGIDNVDIQPWDEATVRDDYKNLTAESTVSSGIYTLYDEDGYIIAMVVVGEDNGNSDSLVYVHSSDLTLESYDENTEEWTWTREVIDGTTGEEVTLTEVDDSGISLLDKMDENKWYRVRFNADGEVTSVRSDNIDTNNDGLMNDRPDQDFDFEKNWDLYSYNNQSIITANENAPYAYVWNYAGGAINSAINTKGVDTVLYHQIFGVTDEPHNDGKTLYVTTDKDGYIRYTDDTAVVFEQENNNEWTTEFWAGQSGVERALRELRLGDQKGYSISALIEDGRALTIIIRDNSEDGDSGSWTEDNMVTNGNGMFRLWGYNYDSKNSNLYGAEAESVNYTYDQAFVDYSFYVYADLNGDGKYTDADRLADTEVTYDLRIVSKGDNWVDTLHKTATTNGAGLIRGTFDLANHDEVVDIYVQNVKRVNPVNPDEGMVTLQYNTAAYDDYEFWVNGKPQTSTPVAPGTSGFQMKAGDEVTLYNTTTTGHGKTGTFAIISNPVVLANVEDANTITFTVPADATGTLTLNNIASVSGYYTVNVGAGLTLTDANGNVIENGEQVKSGTVVTVDYGTGVNHAIYRAGAWIDTLHSSSTIADGATYTVTGDVAFYAAAQITLPAYVTATYEKLDGTTQNIASSTNYYYAVGTELTLENANASQGIVETTGGATYSADWNKVPFKVENEDRSFNTGYVVTLGNGLSATIDGETYGAGDSFAVNGGLKLNGIVTLDTKVGGHVIKTPANGVFAASTDEWVLASTEVNASVSLVAATKVTTTGSATVDVGTGVPGKYEPVLSANETVYVLNGKTLVAENASSVTSVDGSMNITPPLGVTEFTVGNSDITVAG